ncbi:MAG TPA: dihydropteroate synthase [Chitinophagaceae bacterium]|nr:dihydropteroate synthase [Chitinophagaceae bacterium]
MFTLNCNGRLLAVDKPLVMGIINTTPDSFYSGSRFTDISDILRQAAQMLRDGADMLDIGGQSTRPGSAQVGAAEELQRVLQAIGTVSLHFPEAIISIDTYHASVARQAVEAGACIVNDISGGQDQDMLPTVASLNVPYVCMHIKGMPDTMQQYAEYEDVSKEVLDYFIRKKEQCLQAGIKDIIIDPGFGFAKTAGHNFTLLHNLSVLHMLQCPILVGLSRKSTIYKTLGTDAAGALNGTTVMNTIALLNGAHILRVHDVKEAKEAVNLVSAYTGAVGH